MASFDHLLNSVRQYLKDAGKLTAEMQEQLENLRNIVQNFQEIERIQTEENQPMETLENACNIVLHSNYIILKFNAANLSKLCEMDQEASKLPQRMQPKFKEIKTYYSKIKENIEAIDAYIKEIETKIKEARKRKFRISEDEKTELEMLIDDIKCDLDIAENYLKNAEKALGSLHSEITSYLIECGVLAVAKTAASAAVGAAAGAGGVVAFGGTTKNIVRVVKSVAGLAAVVQAAYQVYSIYSEYDKLKKTKCNELESELNILKREYEARKLRLPSVEKKTGRLKLQEN